MKSKSKAGKMKKTAYRCEFCGAESNNQEVCCWKKMKKYNFAQDYYKGSVVFAFQ